MLTVEGNVLPDEAWHVTAYYDNIRNKVTNLDPSLGNCIKDYNGTIPTRICQTQMRVRNNKVTKSMTIFSVHLLMLLRK